MGVSAVWERQGQLWGRRLGGGEAGQYQRGLTAVSQLSRYPWAAPNPQLQLTERLPRLQWKKPAPALWPVHQPQQGRLHCRGGHGWCKLWLNAVLLQSASAYDSCLPRDLSCEETNCHAVIDSALLSEGSNCFSWWVKSDLYWCQCDDIFSLKRPRLEIEFQVLWNK